MQMIDLTWWPAVIVEQVIDLPADRHRRGYPAERQSQPSWPRHRVIDGAVCRQDTHGGRWERLDKVEADRLLDRATGFAR